jgi:hypothetical protein
MKYRVRNVQVLKENSYSRVQIRRAYRDKVQTRPRKHSKELFSEMDLAEIYLH